MPRDVRPSAQVTTSPTTGLRDGWRIDEASLADFQQALASPPDGSEWFALRRAAERLALTPGFDSLITLNANTIKELPHQIDVALGVLRHIGGRALLADEVGLGKTIEAGIVLKELGVRGLAQRAFGKTSKPPSHFCELAWFLRSG